ncbi:MAG: 3-hydroxyacyl-CoA dehydrogenase NAD-binding domain-containing protein [Anaeromyxobacter sp.]
MNGGRVLSIETVAVVGAGEAGTRFAVLAALAGCSVRVHDTSPGALERGFEAVRQLVEAAGAAGMFTPRDRQRILDGVLFTTDLDEAVIAADLVLDAGGEGAAERLARLTVVTRASSPLATVDAPPADLARLPQPGRVLALRLAEGAGPVPQLLVVPAAATAAHAIARAEDFARRLNRAAQAQDAA